jgi:CHASE2 domain-containing sensor protein/anti-sigma regulatory factor (Ser/Thr protein kinase)
VSPLFKRYYPLSDLSSSALILILLTCLLHITQVFQQVNYWIFDVGQRLTTQAPPKDIVIVAIDQTSLAKIGRWPWSREFHAQLIRRIQAEQPAVIGFDIIFAEPELITPSADEALAMAMRESGRVVLPVLIEATRVNGQVVETLPLPGLAKQAADMGSVHAVLDSDGIARSVYQYEGVGAPYWQLFAQAVLNVAQQKPTKNQIGLGHAEHAPYQFTLARVMPRLINFTGPPGHFARISYAQVLSGVYPKGLFNNKVVLIGATALGMNDLLTTPVSFSGQPMAGVEFHANVLNAIRNNALVHTVPLWLSGIVMMCCAVMPLIWLPKLRPLIGFVTTLVFLVCLALLAGIMPKLLNIWIPPAAGLVTLILAYPVWSWRKLESAHTFLDEELRNLHQQLQRLPAQQIVASQQNYDQFDARIAQVRRASEQLRFLQNDREETLAFISHDIRAPLAAALMVAERSSSSLSLRTPLAKALALAEDFLQTSRAEMMSDSQFNEIDMVGLVHQAIDDAYEASTLKNILLQRNLLDGVVWVNGNFGLLHRAIFNLISNAIKYSPSHQEVIITLRVSLAKSQVLISVQDKGPGINADTQQGLFKRFSRVKAHETSQEGTGLGLYFVKTVLDKHAGTISVESTPGLSTVFTLQLPMKGFQAHQD